MLFRSGYWATAPLALSAMLVALWAGEPEERQKRVWPQRMERNGYVKFLIAIPIVLFGAVQLDALLGTNILFRIAMMGFIYPLVDLTIRRAHDVAWSGHIAWVFVLPPITGAIGNWTAFVTACGLVLAVMAALAVRAGNGETKDRKRHV